MFKKAKKQFLQFSMLATMAVNITLIVALNLVNYYLTDTHLSKVMREIAKYRYEDKEEVPGNVPPLELAPGELKLPVQEMAEEATSEPTEEEAEKAVADETTTGIQEESGEGKKEDSSQNKHSNTKKEVGRHSAYTQYQGRFFSVVLFPKELDSPDNAVTQHILEEVDLVNLVHKVIKGGKQEGYFEDFRYMCLKGEASERICFLDCSTERAAERTLWISSLALWLVGVACSFFYLYAMSEKIMQPLKEGMDKQKRFITDAGHELKTPISVIGANMDLLAMDLGENEWVEISQRQIKKLRKLVGQLISLSRVEEKTVVSMEPFSISEAVIETLELFAGVAAKMKKELKCKAEENLVALGDEASLRELLAILMDNALKYAIGESPIEVRLYGEGKRVYFEILNEWDHSTPVKDLDCLFDRFYRSDPARDRSNGKEGYGLGLAIAKAVAEKSNVLMKVYQDDVGRIAFQAVFRRG